MAGMSTAERLTYQMHTELRSYRYRVRQAESLIVQGLEMMRAPSVSLSFGKDSTTMAHLLLRFVPSIPIFYVNCGEFDEWPDTARVKAEFVARCPCNLIELQGISIMKFYRRVGFLDYANSATLEARKAKRDYAHSLADTLEKARKAHGCDGAFIGMRAEESDARNRLFAYRGPLYYASDRQAWACCPLYRWTSRDVWAYIMEHNLPYNELYDIDPRGRELARNGTMIGGTLQRVPGGMGYAGRLAYVRKMYPEWFDRFAAEFPEVRAYV